MVAKRSFTALQQAAQTALDVENTISLSGVLHTLDHVITDVIWPEARKQGKGTEFINAHPIVTLFLHKLTTLNGSECFCSACVANYSRATAEVEAIVKGVR